jgi:hypothetical protein
MGRYRRYQDRITDINFLLSMPREVIEPDFATVQVGVLFTNANSTIVASCNYTSSLMI